MTDTPPKSKPGSLRDRIAAFEKDAAAVSSAPKPPPTRPKPGHVTWKPAPSSPSAPTGPISDDNQHHGAMSANDAKESIGASGGLKERMAALQGKVSFGGMGAGAPPPVPKPLKRPPLVVPSPPLEDEHEEEPKQVSPKKISQENINDTVDNEESSRLTVDEKDGKEEIPAEEDQDEAAKERERRAAIAARMARLGGARIGMAPPIIAKKPERRKITDPSEEKAAEAPSTSTSEGEPTSSSENKTQTATALSETDISPGDGSNDITPQLEHEAECSSEQRPITESDTPHEVLSQPSFSSSHSSLPSVPLPAIPRRPQGPPRHKGSSRSLQSDPKTEEAGTEAALERSVQDTIDIPSAVEANEPEQTLSGTVPGNAEERQPQAPEAAPDAPSPTDIPTQQNVEPGDEVGAHISGTDAEIATLATPETITTVDTPGTVVIAEHSFSDGHMEPVVIASQVQQPGMPVDDEHDGSDAVNTVTKHVENVEDIENTGEVEEDTEDVVEDRFKLM